MSELRTMDVGTLRRVYQEHVTADFPPAERKPLAAMEKLVKAGVYEPLGLYEGQCLQAYAFLWHSKIAPAFLVDYLAVCRGGRGQGTGSALLTRLSRRCSGDRLLFLESEAITSEASESENQLRRRRLDFYHRAGFRYAGYDVRLFGVLFSVLRSYGTGLSRETLMTVHQSLYQKESFQPIGNRFIAIPRQEMKGLQ